VVNFHLVWPHNPATEFWPPSAAVVSTKPFSHRTRTLHCLQKKMVTYRHWSVSLWWDPDDVPHWQNWMAAYLGYTLRMKSEDAVLWLTNYGSWHAYEKQKNKQDPHSTTGIHFDYCHSWHFLGSEFSQLLACLYALISIKLCIMWFCYCYIGHRLHAIL